MNCKKKCLLVAMLTCSVSIFLLFNIVSIIVHARLNNVFYLYIYIYASALRITFASLLTTLIIGTRGAIKKVAMLWVHSLVKSRTLSKTRTMSHTCTNLLFTVLKAAAAALS